MGKPFINISLLLVVLIYSSLVGMYVSEVDKRLYTLLQVT